MEWLRFDGDQLLASYQAWPFELIQRGDRGEHGAILLPSELNKKSSVGNDLLSQGLAPQLPSALKGLTAGFGMGPGVPPSLASPTEHLLRF